VPAVLNIPPSVEDAEHTEFAQQGNILSRAIGRITPETLVTKMCEREENWREVITAIKSITGEQSHSETAKTCVCYIANRKSSYNS